MIPDHVSKFNLDISDSGRTVDFAASGMGAFEFEGSTLEATFHSAGLQTISIIATDGCSTAIQSIAVDVIEGEYVYLGEGECRQGNGEYPIIFSRDFSDLSPHTSGDNADQAALRCQDLCVQYGDWCLAAQTITSDIWPTPSCDLITDHSTWTDAGMTYDSDTWGGLQLLDGVSYQTFCGGGSSDSCTTRDIGLGITLNPREGYHCDELAL